MDLIKRIEPKYNTLIQACVIIFLLVLVSFVYDNEEQASSEQQAVAVRR